MKKLIVILAVVLVAMLALTACTPQDAQGPDQVKDRIVVVIPQDPDYLDPHKAAASGTEEVMFNVFEGLVKSDAKGKLMPAVAQSYSVSDDGLTYSFVLRQGILFHNGSPVTIADVEYSYLRLRGDITGEALSSGFEGVAINVVDAQTIEFMLPEVNASFIGYLTEAVIPQSLTEEDLNQAPIGTGPYKFVEYLPSQRIVLEKFADYWQPDLASIKEVEFRIFADNQTALMSLQAGEVDVYPRIPTESLDMIPDNYYFVEGPQNMVQIMAMNNDDEIFKDLRVRQAINYAVDVDEVINAVADGRGVKLGSNMSPAMGQYFQDGLQDTYNLNIEKAQQLLKEAGYENGLELTITVPSNYQFHVDTAQVIAQQLSAVNINATIEQVEWSIWLDDVYTNRNYQMTIIGLTGKLDPHPILNRYASDYPRNFFNYANDAYDQLMKDALVATDQDNRAAIYREAQTILAQDVPCVYIMDPNYIVALNGNLVGYQLYPIYVQDIATLSFK